MEENTFMQEVARELSMRGYDAEIISTYKNNEKTDALAIRLEGTNAAPLFYEGMLKEMADAGANIPEMADAVAEFTEQHNETRINPQLYQDRDYILSHAVLAICREDWNRERMEAAVHERVPGTDLTVYPKILGDAYAVTVTPAFLEHVNITREEMMAQARENSRETYKVRGMREVMEEMYGAPLPFPGEETIMVISSRSGSYGASGITDAGILEQAQQMLHADAIYIIPSSIHEIIAIPAGTAAEEELSAMVKEVNHSSVSRQEQLSDHPYYYDGKALRMAKEETHTKQYTNGRGR